MKLELMFSTSRESSLSTLAGNGPHIPRDTNDSLFRLESLVMTVKNESIENPWDRVLCGMEKFAADGYTTKFSLSLLQKLI